MILPKYKGFEQEKKIGEYTLYLPDPPNLKDIAYKDLPQHKQKFQRIELPKDIMSWDAKARYDFGVKDLRSAFGQAKDFVGLAPGGLTSFPFIFGERIN